MKPQNLKIPVKKNELFNCHPEPPRSGRRRISAHRFFASLRMTAGFLLLFPVIASAAPERLQIQADNVKQRRQQAELTARGIDLSRIKDADTRAALQALFAASNLRSRDQVSVS